MPHRAQVDLVEAADELGRIATLADQLTISHADPLRFHLVKDEVLNRMARVAGRLRAEARPAGDTRVWRRP